jgi:hypothetical protein
VKTKVVRIISFLVLIVLILALDTLIAGAIAKASSTKPPIWSGIRISHPELAYALLISAVLGFSWSVIYTAMNPMTRRAK